jgi:hypothetical protein
MDQVIRTWSGRVSRPVHKYVTQHHNHLQTQAIDPQQYSIKTAKVIAKTINKLNHQFAQTCSLNRGIKEFGERGHKAVHEEMKQLHNRVIFIPILIEKLTHVKRKQAMESLIFPTEKKDGRIKARTCANGNTQRKYTDHDKAASSTAMAESHIITAVIEAKQGCNVMTANIPNTFVQMDVEEQEIGDRTIMKIRGQLVNMLVDIAPEE